MTELSAVFRELRDIMQPYADRLVCTADNDQRLSVDTRHIGENQKPLWFGGVETKKNYVSYHLMPVYVNPALLASVSPELKKRMQGKSCFNFKQSQPELLRELAKLTEAGFRDYEKRGYAG